MAQPSTIYRVGIQLSDIDRGLYETLQITVARHPSETEERLLARILAYALYYEPELTFTKGVGAGDEPDLWSKGPDGRVRCWIEVGLPDAERLVKASRHSEQVVLCACGSSLPVWEKQQLPKLADQKGVLNVNLVQLKQTDADVYEARAIRRLESRAELLTSVQPTGIGRPAHRRCEPSDRNRTSGRG